MFKNARFSRAAKPLAMSLIKEFCPLIRFPLEGLILR